MNLSEHREQFEKQFFRDVCYGNDGITLGNDGIFGSANKNFYDAQGVQFEFDMEMKKKDFDDDVVDRANEAVHIVLCQETVDLPGTIHRFEVHFTDGLEDDGIEDLDDLGDIVCRASEVFSNVLVKGNHHIKRIFDKKLKEAFGDVPTCHWEAIHDLGKKEEKQRDSEADGKKLLKRIVKLAGKAFYDAIKAS